MITGKMIRRRFVLTPSQIETLNRWVVGLQAGNPTYIPTLEYSFKEGGTVVVKDTKSNTIIVVDAQDHSDNRSPYKDD